MIYSSICSTPTNPMNTSRTAQYIHHTEGGDDLIAYMARVSNPDAAIGQPSSKLIRYLIKNRHWSPFEMASLCVEIWTTRDISAQIIRHRSFSFQEFSQRYAPVSRAEIPHFRKQDEKNRQNSFDTLSDSKQSELSLKTAKLFSDAYLLYQEMLEEGVAKECARKILPMNSPTRIYMHGTVRSWIHYIDLRSANGTQEEHRQIAEQCRDIFRKCFPQTADAVWGSKENPGFT